MNTQLDLSLEFKATFGGCYFVNTPILVATADESGVEASLWLQRDARGQLQLSGALIAADNTPLVVFDNDGDPKPLIPSLVREGTACRYQIRYPHGQKILDFCRPQLPSPLGELVVSFVTYAPAKVMVSFHPDRIFVGGNGISTVASLTLAGVGAKLGQFAFSRAASEQVPSVIRFSDALVFEDAQVSNLCGFLVCPK